jgi:endonuclease III related protein
MLATADLTGIYRILLKRFCPQHWWPGDSPFEVMAGAILTQNTNWKNVEQAIGNLKAKGLLDSHRMNAVTTRRLAKAIRPAGFFNQKAAYLKGFCRYYVDQYGGDVGRMRRSPAKRLRAELLEQRGIGPETADSILLYALNKPAFVIDAYTKRIFSRHALLNQRASYDDWQHYFTERLPQNVKVYNEFHALIVKLAKEYCMKRPLCSGCPLQSLGINSGRHPKNHGFQPSLE